MKMQLLTQLRRKSAENQRKKRRSHGDGLRLNTHSCQCSICHAIYVRKTESLLATLCETASDFAGVSLRVSQKLKKRSSAIAESTARPILIAVESSYATFY